MLAHMYIEIVKYIDFQTKILIVLISLKMREIHFFTFTSLKEIFFSGIITAICRKAHSAQFVDSNSPEVVNLMSTGTDRIVNSHSFCSIPISGNNTVNKNQMRRY